MEDHVGIPAVYTADTITHAMEYAFPSTPLQDNLYYGVLFQLRVSQKGIKSRRKKGEVRVAKDAIRIDKVYLRMNLDIKQGGFRMCEWDDGKELLPTVLQDRRAHSYTGLLQPTPKLRGRSWQAPCEARMAKWRRNQ